MLSEESYAAGRLLYLRIRYFQDQYYKNREMVANHNNRGSPELNKRVTNIVLRAIAYGRMRLNFSPANQVFISFCIACLFAQNSLKQVVQGRKITMRAWGENIFKIIVA